MLVKTESSPAPRDTLERLYQSIVKRPTVPVPKKARAACATVLIARSPAYVQKSLVNIYSSLSLFILSSTTPPATYALTIIVNNATPPVIRLLLT